MTHIPKSLENKHFQMFMGKFYPIPSDGVNPILVQRLTGPEGSRAKATGSEAVAHLLRTSGNHAFASQAQGRDL